MPTGTTAIDVIADSDTRWKWGALLARRIAPEARLTARFVHGRATPTARQLGEVGVRPDAVLEEPLAAHLHDPALRDSRLVVVAAVGGTVQAALHGLARAWADEPGRRPAVATGYVGVVYEKLADGLLLRAGADLVLANGAADAEKFRTLYREVGADPDTVVEAALPFLSGAPYDPAPAERGDRPYTVTFAAQPSVPETRGERLHLLRRAADHARLHPQREVLVKLRSRPGEHTTHLEEFPYQKLLARLGAPGTDDAPPPNLRLVYGNMGEVLDRTDLCATVSSTAALEAMQRGIPSVILTDLGIREIHGNQRFTGSGCLASWDAIDAGAAPVADPEWLRREGVPAPGTEPFATVRERVDALLDGGRLPPLAPYYTLATAGGYLPRILARQGLDPHGAPAAGAAPPRTAGPLRRTVRRGARGVYRTGVQRMAPLIRRLGEL